MGEYERKGVPLRLELGPRDVASGSALLKSRLGGDKRPVALGDNFGSTMTTELNAYHDSLLEAATRLMEKTIPLDNYQDMKERLALEDLAQTGFFLVPWKDDTTNEDLIKEETKATIRCFPLDRQHDLEGKVCFYSGEPATHMAIFARAF